MKFFKILLILTSVIWTIYNLAIMVLAHQVVNFMGLLTLVPVLTALYSEIDWIYVRVNKVIALVSAKTVSFSPKFQYATNGFSGMQKMDAKIREVLDNNNYKVIDKHQQPFTEENVYLQIQSQHNLKANLSLTAQPTEDENIQLIMKVDYQVSYRDVSRCWDDFIKLKEDLFPSYARVEESVPRYDVTIATGETRFNPFYRLTIRRLGKKVIDNFTLKFREDTLMVETSLHQIYATSPEQATIKKVIDEYVPLTKVQ